MARSYRISADNDHAVARLLEAWRGEVEARAVYTILAERMSDPRRKQVIREIAEGEGRHRERIEKRLRELGQPIPDPSTVRISPWLRLQARFAPVTRMLAHMESNEHVEITDRYKRSTGDPETDAVLASIRTEEQGHSRTLNAIQATHGGEPRRSARARLRQRPVQTPFSQSVPSLMRVSQPSSTIT